MDDNLYDLLKTLGVALVPVLLLWVRMTMTERTRVREKKDADDLAAAQRLVDQRKQAEVATAVKQVAAVQEVATEKLDEATAKVDAKLDIIHTLVNEKLGIALLEVVATRREQFKRSGSDEHKQALERAEDAWKNHDDQQKIVDAQAAKDATEDDPPT